MRMNSSLNVAVRTGIKPSLLMRRCAVLGDNTCQYAVAGYSQGKMMRWLEEAVLSRKFFVAQHIYTYSKAFSDKSVYPVSGSLFSADGLRSFIGSISIPDAVSISGICRNGEPLVLT